MKTKGIYLALILGSFAFWSCSNNQDLSQTSFKTSLNNSVQELNTALNTISTTAGYQVLGVASTSVNSPALVKSSVAAFDSTYNSIMLTDIAGVYNYKATRYKNKRLQMDLTRFFVKAADNAHLIVNLPEEKVLHPNSMLHYSAKDTLLKNNYKIDVSDYNFSFNYRLGYDYLMASTITIDSVKVGNLKIQSSISKANEYNYASEFAFTDNYKAICNYTTGDTAIATYAVNDGTKTLYEEKYTAIKTSSVNRHKEKEYSLTIGDVQIVRGMNQKNNSLDSVKVYVAGVLQLNSKVEFVTDSTSADETEHSVINKKRDLKITFDDGTSTTITDLLGTSINTVRTLFASLRQATFATSVIDWIAWDIYTNKE